MKYLFLLAGILLGYICTPQVTSYEITDVVWVYADPTRLVMLDMVVCYLEPRSES